MNYNEQMQTQEQFVLNTQEDQPQELLFNKTNQYKQKPNIKQSQKNIDKNSNETSSMNYDKQNQCTNNISSNKNYTGIETNHSFNAFFNSKSSNSKDNSYVTNNQKISENKKKSTLSQYLQSNEKNLIGGQKINSPMSNFNSTGKLSNFMFVSQSKHKNTQNSQVKLKSKKKAQYHMHNETKQLMIKFFPDNYQTDQYQDQYVSLTDFVDIIFEEYENVIGKENIGKLFEEFTDKVFLIFGESIYFLDLFEKTAENGLIGLIFEIFKKIEEQSTLKNQKMSKAPLKSTTINKYSNHPQYSAFSSLNSQQQTTKISFQDLSAMGISQVRSSNKVNLSKYFTRPTSVNTSRISEDNLSQVKQILQDYIESMYEHAETQLMKKISNQMRKVTIKHKEVQKVLQKVNDKISNYYDCISLEKQYEKKIAVLRGDCTLMQNKIKALESQKKSERAQIQKEKSQNYKLNQEIKKLNAKLEKYETAIFQRALKIDSLQKENKKNQQKSSSIVIGLSSTVDEKRSSTNSTYQSQANQSQSKVHPPKFQFKIDTITEHKVINSPINNQQQQRSYSPSPYYNLHKHGSSLTPKVHKQIERRSVSPINSRIVFNKPLQNSKSISQLNLSTNSNLKVSHVERVEFGNATHLRPLSPIGKLGSNPSQNNAVSSNVSVSIHNANANSNNINSSKIEQQRSRSPISSSRVITISPIRRRI